MDMGFSNFFIDGPDVISMKAKSSETMGALSRYLINNYFH